MSHPLQNRRRLLLIYPHWPPSNLVGVMRPRLLANYLPQHGWDVIVLKVAPEFYEEPGDPNLIKTVRDYVEVHAVKAFQARKRFRLFGDIALRGAYWLVREGLRICREQRPDFILASIPSFYGAVIARILHNRTGIPYGIDYQDPWVRPLHPGQTWISRHGLSQVAAKLLEPYCVSRVSLLSGISQAYFAGVIDRNPKLSKVTTVEFPIGFDPEDSKIELPDLPQRWGREAIAYLYAGAFLPQSAVLHGAFFETLAELRKKNLLSSTVEFHYLGTGRRPGKTLSQLATDHGIGDLIHEDQDRIPYLAVLQLLKQCTGVLVIGSTEKHYSASKIFQALLSDCPVFAILHKESQAVAILEECNADQFLVRYDPDNDSLWREELRDRLQRFLAGNEAWNPRLDALQPYNADASAGKLAAAMDCVVERC